MKILRVFSQEEVIKDFRDGKVTSLAVETVPVSYKRFVETDSEGNVNFDANQLAIAIPYDQMIIKTLEGQYYTANIAAINVSVDMVSELNKDGNVVNKEDGTPHLIPSVLLFNGMRWPQYVVEYTLSEIKPSEPWSLPEKENAKVIIPENWDDYKDGKSGQTTIPMFEKAATLNVSLDEQMELITKFIPHYFDNWTDKEKDGFRQDLDSFYNTLTAQTTVTDLPTSIDEASDFYEALMQVIDPSFRTSLGYNMIASLNLYAMIPEYFIPNLFITNFIALQRFFDKYDLDLPETPKRSKWREHVMYYMQLCRILYQFRIDNDLSPAELCALMYDYAQRRANDESTPLPEPAQAWLIGGSSSEGEKDATYRFWQANPDTKKGDILIHYEKYPVKAITAVWRAEENGIIDPFFWGYSNTYAGHKIDVPHITLDELKADAFFKNPDSPVGKLINKNFQGVNGWTVSGEDYRHLLSIWKQKGFDVSKLPHLYAPELPEGIVIKWEKDVSNYLLRPMLNSMGWKEHADYEPEMHFKAGRGSAKRPDFCLHITGQGEDVEAKVIFECKLYMKNSKEIEANFTQGRSYAKWGNAQILVLCDKQQLIVYKRKNGSFDRNKFQTFYWKDVMGGNPDKFNELKEILS